MNDVKLIGRIGKDLELKTTNTGKAVCNFSLGVSRGKSKGNDMGTDWIQCVAWEKTAEFLVKYAGKGKLIAVDGSIRTSSYEKDGKKVYKTEVWCKNYGGVELLSSKDSGSSGSADEGVAQEMEIDEHTGYAVVNTDELPF